MAGGAIWLSRGSPPRPVLDVVSGQVSASFDELSERGQGAVWVQESASTGRILFFCVGPWLSAGTWGPYGRVLSSHISGWSEYNRGTCEKGARREGTTRTERLGL
jgi:hypothetical protein